ncbi:MAG: DUF192 domain-containing protein [Ardenticatenia bacterium]|nr:DUF192 domain-containing protein [Ardenticatenia bacterium]
MVRVTNVTRGTVVCRRARIAGSFWHRLRGLMFRRELAPEDGLLLVPEWSIHTFFMRFPIDVIFLSRSDVVLATYEHVRPNRLGPACRGAHKVLELPVGTVKHSQTKEGDQFEIVAA